MGELHGVGSAPLAHRAQLADVSEHVGQRHVGPDDRCVTTHLLITDLAIWKPDPVTKEFIVVSLHPGVSREDVQASCGWVVKFADALDVTPAPTALELTTLRDLQARTRAAHSGAKVAADG